MRPLVFAVFVLLSLCPSYPAAEVERVLRVYDLVDLLDKPRDLPAPILGVATTVVPNAPASVSGCRSSGWCAAAATQGTWPTVRAPNRAAPPAAGSADNLAIARMGALLSQVATAWEVAASGNART